MEIERQRKEGKGGGDRGMQWVSDQCSDLDKRARKKEGGEGGNDREIGRER